jgi:signal transduction histidine kinase
MAGADVAVGRRRRGAALRRPLAAAFGVLTRGQAYRNLLYVVTTLPLGLAYGLLLGAGVLAGLALLPLLVGLPVLIVTVASWWGLGAFERRLAIWWLGADVPPLVRPAAPAGGRLRRWWRRVWAYLRSPLTWTILAYLVLKIPLGLLGLAFLGGLIALAAGLVAAPVPLLLGVADGGAPAPAAAATVAAVVAGLAVWALALHAAGVLAGVAGTAARLMLGSGDTARRLAAAEETAAREQARAAQAERSRQSLIVNVGHELRTPTANIRGHVETLLLSLEAAGGPPGDPRPEGPTAAALRHHLGIVQRETQRLSGMIDELLTLARADAGELHLELTPVASGAVVEEVYQALAPLARRERRVTLVRAVAAGLPPVRADRQRLVQVLLNLVRNAVTYTPEGGIVAVTVERAGAGRQAFTVADTGVGIAAEDLPRVFERFYRADPSRARISGGYGLGLAIVRDLVQAMGGSVTATSVPGEGSRFRVLIPEAGRQAASPAAGPAEDPAEGAWRAS